MSATTSDQQTAYPYITEFKSPPWRFFTNKRRVEDFYLPTYERLNRLARLLEEDVEKGVFPFTVENIFWFLSLEKLLGREVRSRELVHDRLVECLVDEGNDAAGFANSKASRESGANVDATFYALESLQLLGTLDGFFEEAPEERRREKLTNFILSLQGGGAFWHCRKRCTKCRDRDGVYQTLFFATMALEALSGGLGEIIAKVRPFVERKPKTDKQRVFRLVIARVLRHSLSSVEDDVRALLEYQRADGGFNFRRENGGSIPDTFWTVLALDASRWAIDFPKGRLSGFVIEQLSKLDPGQVDDPASMLAEQVQLVVSLSYLWQPLVRDLELVLFECLEDSVMDLDDFVEQGEIHSIEDEVIEYLNLKFKFKLQVLDNDVQFRTLARTLDAPRSRLAEELYKQIRDHVEVDLNRLVTRLNLGRLRRDWVSLDDARQVVTSMIQHHLVKGKFEKRRRFFRSVYYFVRKKLIRRVLTIDQPVSRQVRQRILEERDRIVEKRKDIENFILELSHVHEKILNEVESLILVEEVEWARRRLKVATKEAIYDAELFNKVVEKMGEEFEYHDVDYVLRRLVAEWKEAFHGFRDKFRDVEQVLLRKIEQVERIQKERQDVWDLDEFVKTRLQKFEQDLENLRMGLTSIHEKSPVDEGELKELRRGVESFAEGLDRAEGELRTRASRISENLPETRRRRREIVDYWVKHVKSLRDHVEELRRIFKQWGDLLALIQEHHEVLAREVADLKEKIVPLVDRNQKEAAQRVFNERVDDVIAKTRKRREELSRLTRDFEKTLKLFEFRGFREHAFNKLDETQRMVERLVKEVRETFKAVLLQHLEKAAQENFQTLVDKQIKALEDLLRKADERLNSLHQREPPAAFVMRLREARVQVEDSVSKFNQHYLGELEKARRHLPDVDRVVKMADFRWGAFQQSLREKLDELELRHLRKALKRELLAETTKRVDGKTSLQRVADELGLKWEDARRMVEEMIHDAIIRGEIVGTEVVVHSEEFLKNSKFSAMLEREREKIGERFVKINRLFESAVKIGSLLTNAKEFHQLLAETRQMIADALTRVRNYQVTLGVDPSNEAFQAILMDFRSQVNDFQAQLDLLETRVSKLEELDEYMREKLEFLRNLISSQIKLTLEKIEEGKVGGRPGQVLGSLKVLQKSINSVERDVRSFCKVLWRGVEDWETLIREQKEWFYLEKKKLLNKLQDSREIIDEELFRKQNERYKSKFEQYLQDQMERMNEYLGKIQYYIRRKVETQEFSTATEMLAKKVKEFKVLFEKVQAKVRRKAKEYDKRLKGFTVKNAYLLTRWETFVTEFTQVIREKVAQLQEEVITAYLRLSIRAFKNELVSLSFLSSELKMKRQNLKERLIAAIGKGLLPGKYDPELDIYFENPSALALTDAESLERLELQKLGKYKTYMFMSRLKVIAKNYSPVLALFASSFTIMWYLYQITGLYFIFAAVPTAVAIAVSVGFIYMRRREKLMESVEEKPPDVRQKE
ncbi:MAG: hypothetical protein Kow0069_17520 [Promethearchaeota archaeon]